MYGYQGNYFEPILFPIRSILKQYETHSVLNFGEYIKAKLDGNLKLIGKLSQFLGSEFRDMIMNGIQVSFAK